MWKLCVLLLVGVYQINSLKIAAFNIRRLGAHAVSNHDALQRMIQIVGRYDIAVIEEVMDLTGIGQIVSGLNSQHGTTHYRYIHSDKIGRTSYKEYYGFIYRSDLVSVKKTYQYNDVNDWFEREPFSVLFHVPTASLTDFVITGIHIKPSDAPNEISHLPTVYKAVSSALSNKNVMIAGDYNADCSYLSAKKLSSNPLYTDQSFTWLISSTVDSTASHHTNCAYDRFVVAGDQFKEAIVPHSAKAYNYETGLHLTFDEAWAVSDHYPIELEMKDSVDIVG
ncbi:deoxyribonuclease-1 [Patella vulgata]|uniref:deoxyribonuclease-1 n=1 Tax=Patella vulgata TaxID=6465 RepID=UPI002180360E|nr:deoxyribonuclease-1 [Patella vulgata]XP_055958652.1 deoxyribonuclease-1 [Patella vulgata]